MSNVFPPMISNSPPPIDLQDDEDEDCFGDFTVADLNLDISEFSIGRCSPEIAPVKDKPLTIPEYSTFPTLKNIEIDFDVEKNEDCSQVDQPPTVEMVQCNGHSEINSHETVLNGIVDDDDRLRSDEEPPDESETTVVKLENIPSPVLRGQSPQGRTSPEGADSESECENGEKCEYNNFNSNLHDIDDKSKTEEFCQSVESSINNENDDFDDFADFADFASNPFPSQSSTEQSEKVNGTASADFDDFDAFESAAPLPSATPIEAKRDIDSRVTVCFPAMPPEEGENERLTSCLSACLDDSSSVWGNLKDLETSNALSLQWNASTAGKKLLSSLNIDSRNVLLGPRWNTSVPRFAANLGCEPLEPKKAEAIKVAEPAIENRLASSIPDDVVPAAQFDWNSSGLTNPLDCMEKEEAAIDVPATVEPPTVTPTTGTDNFPPIPEPVLEPHPAWLSQNLADIDSLLASSRNGSIPRVEEVPHIPDSFNVNSSNANDTELNAATWTISSSLSRECDAPNKRTMSPEAYRVVQTLPDLSFLSARNLLIMANQNVAHCNSGTTL